MDFLPRMMSFDGSFYFYENFAGDYESHIKSFCSNLKVFDKPMWIREFTLDIS